MLLAGCPRVPKCDQPRESLSGLIHEFEHRARRRFTLFDLTVLAAATAARFAVFRALGIDVAMRSRVAGESWASRTADQAILSFVPFLIAWTLAFPLIRLRQPRPSLRRLARQPGMAGCTAASVAIVYELIWTPFIGLRNGVWWANSWGFVPPPSAFVRFFGDLVSLWVAAAWMVLALGGRWRARARMG